MSNYQSPTPSGSFYGASQATQPPTTQPTPENSQSAATASSSSSATAAGSSAAGGQPSRAAAEEARKQVSAGISVKDLDARLVEPWLHFTRWHIVLDAVDNAEVIELVALPDDSPSREDKQNFEQLKAHCQSMLRRAEDKLKTTHEIALCRLNTSEPEK